MTKDEIIVLGKRLGLSFNEKANYKDSLAKGWVVFDGCNGQRFMVKSEWSDDEIYRVIGESLVLLGKRMKVIEISRVLSINNAY